MRPNKDLNQIYRTVLQKTDKTSGKGKCSTEKFAIRGNSIISWVILRRRRRLLPIVPRNAKVIIELRESGQNQLANNVMPDYPKGRIKIRGNFKGNTVIHKAGTFYLHMKWGSLVREWEVKVEEPVG